MIILVILILVFLVFAFLWFLTHDSRYDTESGISQTRATNNDKSWSFEGCSYRGDCITDCTYRAECPFYSYK